MSTQNKTKDSSQNGPSSDSEDEEVFFDARYPPEEEAVSTSAEPHDILFVAHGLIIALDNRN